MEQVGRYSVEFRIPGLPSTTNSQGRAHWALKAKEARQWKALVIFAVGRRIPARPLKRAKLTLTRVSSGTIDADGMVSSFKHVIDGLIAAGVIENDRMSNIGFPEYRHEKGKAKEGFIIVRVDETE
jgi:hypothetical protein